MSSIPLPELQVDPVNRALTISDLLQRGQLQRQQLQQGSMQTQMMSQQMQDQQAMTKAMRDSLQSWDGKDYKTLYGNLATNAAQNGASANAVMGVQKNALDVMDKYSTIAKNDADTGSKNIETQLKKNDMITGPLSSLATAPDNELPIRLSSTLNDLTQRGLLDPQHAQVGQQLVQQLQAGTIKPDDARTQIDLYRKGFMANSQMLQEAKDKAELPGQQAKSTQQVLSTASQLLASSNNQGDYESNLNSMVKSGQLPFALARLYPQQFDPNAVLKVGQTPEQQVTTAATAAQRQFTQQMAVSNQQLRQAQISFEQRNINNQTALKSYQYNNTALDKVGLPIEQLTQRIGRLKDTIAQGTPQADALVAPELLTVMAGGQGSGLRMNEAEISRIVGGRSNWQTLQASVNKWSLNPSTANSITPAQRAQIHSLIDVVDNKLQAKESILDSARLQLVNSDNPKEHQAIVYGARNSLMQVDTGPASSGFVRIQASDGGMHDIPAANLGAARQRDPNLKVVGQ
jgi:hypothetical protein